MTVRSRRCTCDIFTPTGGSWTGYESACRSPDCPDHGGPTRGAAEDGWVIITPTGRAGNRAGPAPRRPAALYELK